MAIDGETMETVTDFIFSGSKIIADGDCSHEIKRRLLFGQHIKKKRQYYVNKGPSNQTMVFPVVIYGCENWTIKKAEHWSIDAFELRCWRRILRVPWTLKDQISQS